VTMAAEGGRPEPWKSVRWVRRRRVEVCVRERSSEGCRLDQYRSRKLETATLLNPQREQLRRFVSQKLRASSEPSQSSLARPPLFDCTPQRVVDEAEAMFGDDLLPRLPPSAHIQCSRCCSHALPDTPLTLFIRAQPTSRGRGATSPSNPFNSIPTLSKATFFPLTSTSSVPLTV
jgi:hypothetical protein